MPYLKLIIEPKGYLCNRQQVEYSTIDSIFVCKAETLDIECEEKEIEQCELFNPRELKLKDLAFTSIRNALEIYLKIFNSSSHSW